MNYWEHEYHLWFFLPRAGAKPLWYIDNWSQISTSAEKYIRLARGKAAVRSQQYEADRKTQARFGRLQLNAASNQKWCHTSASTEHFITSEVWAPTWGVCTRENVPPDFYFGISTREYQRGSESELTFGSIVILALRTSCFSEPISELPSTIEQLTTPILSGFKKRQWGVPSGNRAAFTDSIQDLKTTGLMKGGNWQGKKLDARCLDEGWEYVRSEF